MRNKVFDGLRHSRLDAPDRQGAGRNTPGLDVAVAERVGTHSGPSRRVSLVCQRGMRLELPARGPVRRGRRPAARVGPTATAAWSVPYAGAEFGLVVPPGQKASIRWPNSAASGSGIVTGTVALSETDHRGRAIQVARGAARWVQGRRQLDGAFVDADFAAWYLHEHPRLELKLVAEYVPHERWNMAVAVRAKDDAASGRDQSGPRPACRDGGV